MELLSTYILEENMTPLTTEKLNKCYYILLKEYTTLKEKTRVETLKLENAKTELMFSEYYDQYKTLRQKEAQAMIELEQDYIKLLELKKSRDEVYYTLKLLEMMLKQRNNHEI